MPGAISPATGLVKNANSTWLNGRPLRRGSRTRASARPVRLANDANCLAVSEAADGAAAGAAVVFGVILGTGTGGGLVVDGRVVTGANAIAGEWGHNPLPWPDDDERPGPACYCGRARLHRDVPLRAGPGRRLSRAAAARRRAAKTSSRARAPASRRARATLDAWDSAPARSRWRRSSTSSIPTSSCSAADCRGCPDSTIATSRRCGSAGCSPTVVTHRVRPAMHGDASGVRGAARPRRGRPLCYS